MLLERRRERRVLGQEAVAGMHGLGTRSLHGVDQLVDRQVALVGRAGTQQERLVGALHVGRVTIELGVDRDGRDPELLARSDDANGDLAAVCD